MPDVSDGVAPSDPTDSVRPTASVDYSTLTNHILPLWPSNQMQMKVSDFSALLDKAERENQAPIFPAFFMTMLGIHVASQPDQPITLDEIQKLIKELSTQGPAATPQPTEAPDASPTPTEPSDPNPAPKSAKFSPFASRPRTAQVLTAPSSKKAVRATLRRPVTVSTPSDDEIPELDGPASPLGLKTDHSFTHLSQVFEDSMFGKASGFQTPGHRRRSRLSFSPENSFSSRRLSETFSPSEIEGGRPPLNHFRSVSPPQSVLDALDQESFYRFREQSMVAENNALSEAMLNRHKEELKKHKAIYDRKIEREAQVHEAHVHSIQLKLDEIKSELLMRQRELKDLSNKDRKKTEQIGQMETEIAKLTRRVFHLQAEHNSLKRDFEAKCVAFNTIKEEFDVKQEEYEASARQHEATQTELQEVAKNKIELENQVHQLTLQMQFNATVQGNVEILEARNQALTEEVDRLTADLQYMTLSQGAAGRASASVPSTDGINQNLSLHQELAASTHLMNLHPGEDIDGVGSYGDVHSHTTRSPNRSRRGAIRHQGVQTDPAISRLPEPVMVAKLVQEKQQFREQLAAAMAHYQAVKQDLQDTREAHQNDIETMRRWLHALQRQIPVADATVSATPADNSAATSEAGTQCRAAGVDAPTLIDTQGLDIRSLMRGVGQLVSTLRRSGQHVSADHLSNGLFQLVLEYSQETIANRSIFAADNEDERTPRPSPRLNSAAFRDTLRRRKMASPRNTSTAEASTAPEGGDLEESTASFIKAPSSVNHSVAKSTDSPGRNITTCQITTLVIYTLVVYFLGFLTVLFTNHVNLDREPLRAATGGNHQQHQSPHLGSGSVRPSPYGSEYQAAVPESVHSPADLRPWEHYPSAKDPLAEPIRLLIPDPPPMSTRLRGGAHVKRARTADIFMYWLETLLYNGDSPQVPT
ncbi:hypothetical protein H4R33_002788 [Dimargaris cristalligena]|uniref:Uncharacterized protein n=1 Tax=Dimargaris cristalligena TaxID=215637 RepID=A0A4P9ZZN8_9FUNG|nr:hypothetical protein H4R33_002788 [Dimargaris cristalligena]RKP38908.1 hypothetical protein BJ085DRAFT_36360 [Dimargaris cristalligena]|eukprot:RKP38908.1 hypothetical protein BJ085DRAFT_36360 [Dimargaris cristalligena]